MPILWALANPKIGEREVLAAMLEVDADLVAGREGVLPITDKGFASRPFERTSPSRASSYCGRHSSGRKSGTGSRYPRRSAS
jgi:hypothetical protein